MAVVAAGHTGPRSGGIGPTHATRPAPHHPTCTRTRHLAHIHTLHSIPDKPLSFTAEIDSLHTTTTPAHGQFPAQSAQRSAPGARFVRTVPPRVGTLQRIAPSDGRIAPSDGRVAMPVPRRGPSQPCHPYADMQLSTAEPCSAMGDKPHPYAQLSLALVESLLVSI